MTVIEIEYRDYGAQGEYGLWGKTVARSIVRGWTPEQIAVEVAEMLAELGSHIAPVVIEEVGPTT